MNDESDWLAEQWESRGAMEGLLTPVMQSGSPHWFNEALAEVQERALDGWLTTLAQEGSVLEIGCGTGRWLAELRARGATAVGVDRSESMLTKAASRAGSPLIRASAEHLPLRDRSIDAVLSVTVLQHLRPDDQIAGLMEARRITRDGGAMCMLERIGASVYPGVYPRRARAWISAAHSAGWALVGWQGVEYWPLVRLLAGTVARVRRYDPVTVGERLSPDGPPTLRRRIYWSVMRAATLASLKAEGMSERFLPRSAASHGLFVLRAT